MMGAEAFGTGTEGEKNQPDEGEIVGEELIEIVYIDGKKKRKIKRKRKKKKVLTKEQIEEIKSAFELFDKHGS